MRSAGNLGIGIWRGDRTVEVRDMRLRETGFRDEGTDTGIKGRGRMKWGSGMEV